MVKGLRHRPFTAVTRVRIPHGSLWRHSQVVRQRSATPLSPVQIRVAPLESPGFTELAVGLGLFLLRGKEQRFCLLCHRRWDRNRQIAQRKADFRRFFSRCRNVREEKEKKSIILLDELNKARYNNNSYGAIAKW